MENKEFVSKKSIDDYVKFITEYYEFTDPLSHYKKNMEPIENNEPYKDWQIVKGKDLPDGTKVFLNAIFKVENFKKKKFLNFYWYKVNIEEMDFVYHDFSCCFAPSSWNEELRNWYQKGYINELKRELDRKERRYRKKIKNLEEVIKELQDQLLKERIFKKFSPENTFKEGNYILKTWSFINGVSVVKYVTATFVPEMQQFVDNNWEPIFNIISYKELN